MSPSIVRSLVLLIAFALPLAATAAEPAVEMPPPARDLPAGEGLQTVVFAGGCFWGVQGVFQHVEGVANAVSGYAGGAAETAHYKIVTSGRTGHAESVEITYDPSVVSYGKLLHIYFSVAHNPTQLNYQGPDIGTHYRSTVFYTSAEERAVVEEYIAQLDAAGVFPKEIVTTLEPLEAFYEAEDYHQDFVFLNPAWPYVVVHDLPKIGNLQRLFPDEFRSAPVLVSDVQRDGLPSG